MLSAGESGRIHEPPDLRSALRRLVGAWWRITGPVLQRTCATYLGDPPGWLKEKMFSEPGGISIAGGNMYVADTNNHRIQIVDMKTKNVSTLNLQGVDPVRRASAVSEKK